MCHACLEKKYGGPLGGTSAKAGRGHSKVVTFGGATELEWPVGTAAAGEGEESGLLRRLLSKATVAMPTIGLKVSQLSEREGRYERGPVAWSLNWKQWVGTQELTHACMYLLLVPVAL